MCQVPWKVTQNVRINEVGSFREVEEPWMKQGLRGGATQELMSGEALRGCRAICLFLGTPESQKASRPGEKDEQ